MLVAPCIKCYDENTIQRLLLPIMGPMKIRQEESVLCFYYRIRIFKKNYLYVGGLSGCQVQGLQAESQIPTLQRKETASKNQPVTRQIGQGKQSASKNQQVTRQQIVSKILSVKDLLKECEVNEGEEGIFLER
ncbi:hypothetical protein PVAP13_8KG074603 [Panicum virgatum]|uniref:Uncharacterized protein n=1 Tax=Panicum virgatum TaxID=38727 RepID=A0A8T0PLH4_PANVG|nr:hypothetical protein PVAP13_8KG074603 [Panicum virgatum]